MPEIKLFDTHFPTNRNLETNVKGILVAGDGTGKSRGIVGAGIYGIIAAQGIAEKDYHDQQLSIIRNKLLAEIQKMKTAGKREILMKHRKDELRKLISVYYSERG